MLRRICRDFAYTLAEARQLDIRDVYGVLYPHGERGKDSRFVAQFIQNNLGKWIQNQEGLWFRPTEDWLRKEAKRREGVTRIKAINDGARIRHP